MIVNFDSLKDITAQSYNDLVADINLVYGIGTGDAGYGGNSSSVISSAADLPGTSIGAVVDNAQWLDLRNAFDDCAKHQGTILSSPLPLITNLEDGDEIGFGPDAAPLFANLNGPPPNNVTELTTNRLNFDILNFENSTKLTSVRTASWGISPFMITHEFTITFVDSDHARHFFNTGGEFQISASRTGGSASAQNTAWTDLLNAGGTTIFTGIDYFALTGSYVVFIAEFASTSTTYANPIALDSEKNKWIMSIKRDGAVGPNGGNGSIIRVKSEFTDGFFGPTQDALGPPGVPVGGLPDSVDGVFTSTISQKRSSVFFNIPSPIFTNIVQLAT